jgi:hypothetical protein
VLWAHKLVGAFLLHKMRSQREFFHESRVESETEATAAGLIRCPPHRSGFTARMVPILDRAAPRVFLAGGSVMLRKVIAASLVLVLSVGVVFADEIRAVITKVEGGKVTFAEMKGKGQKGDEQTLPVAKNVKIVKGKFNRETKTVEAGDAIPNGLKNKMFTDISEKGVRALIITEDKKITEIRIFGGKGKGKKQ